ncbi:MAG: HEPN domain-containing protein [Armatimonadetes bacterium]|nr:HEPN domain-containing protein [Armatimonadota bacterium]PIU64590.1 MAG: DNA-binding protein [Armatimonadetes bacterium CG07_land_8_20_14_0_80_59_28]PIX39827.1 MAG: DNA-binding protein [Armatimonadetes bacterium CG_4_8_14_3_um_filter_58_9]PJB74260.1 MAG: DNA-binding protein [Armatimonadetes bacterium CG_4_9_14_3_um_filter_58_7]
MLKATANWLAQVDYDIGTAEHMLNTGRYIYVIFMCHLSLEKALKAVVSEETQKLPPLTHDLLSLLHRAQLNPSRDDLHFLAEINDVSVVTPYPEDLPNWLCNTLNTLRENTW